ncbi:MAG: thiamine pyrophosphate-dependent enzyme [Oscillospiraceae bacterium]|nr:thiamine pyrophosphate-dependent enzyme [Oscillospiraceae bacterium]
MGVMNKPDLMNETREAKEYEKYIRYGYFPTTWCPGCSDGVILKSIAMVLSGMKIDPDDIAVVSGIGCSGRMVNYFNTNTLHTTHGRALTFATGIKLSRPDKLVLVVSGDGDACAIGGNHLIHAARRNIGIKLLIVNNGIYGMTGGQVSPTTRQGHITETTSYGNVDPNFDLVELLKGAGATFVARESVGRITKLNRVIKSAFMHDGFAAVEILASCHVNLGRRNKMRNPFAMLEYLNEITYPLEKADMMSDEEKEGKLALGIFVDKKGCLEYTDLYYNRLVPTAQKALGAKSGK